MDDIEILKRQLDEESSYKLSSDVMNQFLERTELLVMKRGQPIIDEGEVNKDIYILKKGIAAYTYMNGSNERCFAFALPPTLIFATPCYYLGEPSFYRISTCCHSELLHITKNDFDDLIMTSAEFSRFAFGAFVNQVYLYERKNILINGTITEQFNQMVALRPEIMRHVTSKLIASYLGISQQHLCRLKKQMIKRLNK